MNDLEATKNVVSDVSAIFEGTGQLVNSIKRNNKEVLTDRAKIIVQNLYIKYKREIEDIQIAISLIDSKQAAHLDFSPKDTVSLELPNNIDIDCWISEDIKFEFDRRELTIKLQLASNRFNTLFSGKE